MKVRVDFLGPPRSTDKTTLIIKVSKGAKIRNRYNQVPHLTQAILLWKKSIETLKYQYIPVGWALNVTNYIITIFRGPE